MRSDPLPAALRGASGGVFFLHGDDEFRKEAAARALVDVHLDDATRDFNFDLLRGSELDVETLASFVSTPPMMADWRVVWVRGAEAIASMPRAREVILELLERPVPGLALILQATIPSRSKAKFYQTLLKNAHSVEFGAISANDVPDWLMRWASDEHGVKLEQGAARALAGAVGADLGILAREIEKLASMVGEGGTIDRAAVETAGTRLPRQDRWQWFDLVGQGEFSAAAEGLRVLLGQGESGVGLTIGLGTHLLRLGVLVEDGPAALKKRLPPRQEWLVRRLAEQAGRWTMSAIRAAILELRNVDVLLKSGGFSDEHVLEDWLLKQQVRAGARR